MWSLVTRWLGSSASPIGVDFGSESLKLAQVAQVGGEWRLIAAASADLPGHVRHNPALRMEYLAATTRDLLVQGRFQGRSAVLALPAATTFVQHLRLPKMDDEATRKALPWEARGKLPIDPSHALLRHHVAGEVYQEQEARQEVILMAAGRDVVNQYLAAASRAKLDIVGMNVEAKAILDCFSHVYRRKTDADAVNCFVDIGCTGTRVVIARGTHMLFARNIAVGGDHFTRAVAASLGMTLDEARLLRLRLCGQQAQSDAQKVQEPSQAAAAEAPADGSGLAVLNAALSAAQKNGERPVERRGTGKDPMALDPSPAAEAGGDIAQSQAVQKAYAEPLRKLVEELDLCRRYYEATFQNRPVDRLVFVGGEAKHRTLCQHIAREMGLAAQVGDPLVRIGRESRIGIDSGIDCRLPQPNWAVAIGLSMGPARTDASATRAA